MNEIGKQLADRQITRGGNIIMVQVENEYGSYATDKSYIAKNRDILREAGFTDVPLFQCDWSSNFLNNALDDLVWTVNFGTGANIDEQFKKLKEVRPNTPLMCSEFWSGWFDHWGRKHETRDAETMIAGLRDMLDRNISFSLYMTHGRYDLRTLGRRKQSGLFSHVQFIRLRCPDQRSRLGNTQISQTTRIHGKLYGSG